jgi:small-conductance mechanosensitive channel
MTINRILTLDALTCGWMGIVLVASAAQLSTLLALPPDLLFYAGCLLLPTALFMAALGRQATPRQAGLWLVILGNAAWVLASIATLIIVGPNILGALFIGIQALVVAVLAMAEFNSVARRPLPEAAR